jgi:hypothetical protein
VHREGRLEFLSGKVSGERPEGHTSNGTLEDEATKPVGTTSRVAIQSNSIQELNDETRRVTANHTNSRTPTMARRDFLRTTAMAAGVIGFSGITIGMRGLPYGPASGTAEVRNTNTSLVSASGIQSAASSQSMNWSNIAGAPFIMVTPNGPSDGGNYGWNTPGTTTAGIQEAIDTAEDGAIIVIGNIDVSGEPITIDKNISLLGFRNPRTSGPYTDPSLNPQIGALTVTSANTPLYSVLVDGIAMDSLTVDAVNNMNHATTFNHCRVNNGITIAGDQLEDFIAFHECELRADSSTTLFNFTNTSNGGNGGVNQFFVSDSMLDVEAPSGGKAIIFNIGSQAQVYPIVSNVDVSIKGTATSGVIFEGVDLYQLYAVVQNWRSELFAPVTLLEILAPNQTRPFNLTINFEGALGSFSVSGANRLFNVTTKGNNVPTNLGSLTVKATNYADNSSPFVFGTLTPAVPTSVSVISSNSYGLSLTTPAIPSGTGTTRAVSNTYPFAVMVSQSGSSGTQLLDTMQKTSGAFPIEPSSVILPAGWKIYYTTAVPKNWKWVMLPS